MKIKTWQNIHHKWFAQWVSDPNETGCDTEDEAIAALKAEIGDLQAHGASSPKLPPCIVQSDSLCDYCQFGNNEDPAMCGACDVFNCFRGRKLLAARER